LTFVAWPVGYIGICGHFCGCCGHLAAIIITGIFRYSDLGEKCASLDGEIPYDIDDPEATFTFADHGSMIQGLFISACVLFCGFTCFVLMMAQVSSTLIALKRGGGLEQ